MKCFVCGQEIEVVEVDGAKKLRHHPSAPLLRDVCRGSWEPLGVKFRIYDNEEGKSIVCLKCGMVSWNPNDVKNKYCGNCHEFIG